MSPRLTCKKVEERWKGFYEISCTPTKILGFPKLYYKWSFLKKGVKLKYQTITRVNMKSFFILFRVDKDTIFY